MFSNNLGCKNIKQRAKSTLGAIFQINVPGGLAFAKPAFDMKGIHFMKKPGVETFHLWIYLNCPLVKESLSFCNTIVIACHIIFICSWGENHTFTISIQPKIDRPFQAFI